MSDNPGMAEIEKFDKSKLKMTETHEKKIYRLQKKQLNRRSKRENRNEARATNLYSTFHKHCLLILLLLALYLCKMQRGWIKFK